ncbi:DNA glycosylase [Mycena floridula]|nr:DNA glycosylase [Mycena floridula]
MACPPGFAALPLPIAQLSLEAVLKCGQSFRWTSLPLSSPTQPTHEYRFCLKDRVVCLRQTQTTLFHRSVFPEPQPSALELPLRQAETLVWLNDYFQLSVDLQKLYGEWAQKDKVFAGIQHRYQGIRVLRQDPWETLVSFICSANNNISRITKMVQSLSTRFSPPLLSMPDPSGENNITYHPFPSASELAAAPELSSTLRSLGFGYRAEYLERTSKMVDEHDHPDRWLSSLRDLSTEDAREELLKFVGVGRKVADCILLMSLDKAEVIPVDTHVLQIASKHYGLKAPPKNMTPKVYDDVSSKLAGIWGSYAGWAHSVMFTADLKSFSSYGLPVPILLPTPPATPSPRKRRALAEPGDEYFGEHVDKIKRPRGSQL